MVTKLSQMYRFAKFLISCFAKLWVSVCGVIGNYIKNGRSIYRISKLIKRMKSKYMKQKLNPNCCEILFHLQRYFFQNFAQKSSRNKCTNVWYFLQNFAQKIVSQQMYKYMIFFATNPQGADSPSFTCSEDKKNYPPPPHWDRQEI